jgi:hypothetical protein
VSRQLCRLGPLDRSAGLLIGRTHLSRMAVSLVGGDPGVPMSHTNGQPLVKIWSKSLVNPLTSIALPELLSRSPNFTKTLQILPIQKLCSLSWDTTFMLSGI